MNFFLAFMKKELLLELRAGRRTVLFLGFSFLGALFSSLALSGSFLAPDNELRCIAPLAWTVLFLSGTLAASWSLDAETRTSAAQGLLFSGFQPWTIFLGKAISLATLCVLSSILVFAVFSSLSSWSLLSDLPELLLVSLLVSLAFASLATLVCGLSSSSTRSFLFPLLFFPLMFPLFFAALELSQSFLVADTAVTESFWFSFLLALDVLYLSLGLSLFEYTLVE